MKTVKSKAKPIIDKRNLTSAINGLKGGRPTYFYDRAEVLITKKDAKQAVLAEDPALAIELAIKRVFPDRDIVVQTLERLQKAKVLVNYKQKNIDCIYVDGAFIKMGPEFKNYLDFFFPMYKDTKEFRMFLRVPKSVKR